VEVHEHVNQRKAMVDAGYILYADHLPLSNANALAKRLMRDEAKLRRLGGTGNYSRIKVYPTFTLEQGSIHNPVSKTEYGIYVRRLDVVDN
jgi:hypothetical protein